MTEAIRIDPSFSAKATEILSRKNIFDTNYKVVKFSQMSLGFWPTQKMYVKLLLNGLQVITSLFLFRGQVSFIFYHK